MRGRKLSARVAIITGGSRGIGRVTAMRLLLNGWKVAFTYSQSRDAALAFAAESKGNAVAFEADVRDEDANRHVADEVIKQFGAIDALVNNAGVRRDALLYNMTGEQWDEVLDTNVSGAWSMTKSVLPQMMQQRRGAIVNVASLSGLHGVVG
ncbi:MAG TPA: SDR family NAD(P)-dependent oxidoreductase, partial [Thermoanaerobaculia bacterium]